MARRAKKTAKKQRTRKTAAKRKKTVKPGKIATKKSSAKTNYKAHLKAYQELQKQVDLAWKTLQADVKKNAPIHILIRDKNKLLLLLGECNYMARECMKYSS